MCVKNRRLKVARTRTAVAATVLCPVVCTELWHHEQGMKYATKVTNYTYVTGQRAFLLLFLSPFCSSLLKSKPKNADSKKKNSTLFWYKYWSVLAHEPNGTGKWKCLHIFLCFHTSALGFPLSLMQDGAGLYLDIPTQWPWQSVEESILFVKGNSSTPQYSHQQTQCNRCCYINRHARNAVICTISGRLARHMFFCCGFWLLWQKFCGSLTS